MISPAGYGLDICPLILREENRLMVFKNKMLMRMFGAMKQEEKEDRENYVIRSFFSLIIGHFPVATGQIGFREGDGNVTERNNANGSWEM
jgi:hypothetical protein